MNQKQNYTPSDGESRAEQAEKTREGKALTHESRRSSEEFTAESEKPVKEKTETTPTFVSGILKAVIYITAVVIVSIFFAVTICYVANDVFALKKSADVVEVDIPENASVSDLSEILGSAHVVDYPVVFRLYARLKHVKENFISGVYEVSPSMNYDELFRAFRLTQTRQVVRVTIPEGYTVNNIIDLFVSQGIGTKEGFVAAINDFDYSEYFPFLATLYENPNENRYYRLEGYLYPDTYDFYTDAKESQIVYKLLENFETKFSGEMEKDAAEAGFTMDEILILASFVQKEAYYYEDYETVSSVFRNRLKNRSAFPKLESDATVTYALELLTGEDHHGEVTAEDLEIDSPYNTRMYPGLTPGPICNPGYDAIMCALYPASTNYYYFVSDKDGYNIFSKTYDEHLRAVARVRAEKEQAQNG